MGRTPVAAPMFTRACRTIRLMAPEASRRPASSGALLAVRRPRKRRTAKRVTIPSVPTSPASSPMMEKMKSVWALGR